MSKQTSTPVKQGVQPFSLVPLSPGPCSQSFVVPRADFDSGFKEKQVPAFRAPSGVPVRYSQTVTHKDHGHFTLRSPRSVMPQTRMSGILEEGVTHQQA